MSEKCLKISVGVPQMGVKEMEIGGYLRKKAFFPPFSGFSRCRSGAPEKSEKGRKRAKKADFGWPFFVTPPFAAAQIYCGRGRFRTCFRHFSDMLSWFSISGLSNDMPVTILASEAQPFCYK